METSMLFSALLTKLKRLMLSFWTSETGMTLPLLAVSLVAITGMVGMAIDTARMQLVQSKLQFSLDAAGLAAGSTVSDSVPAGKLTVARARQVTIENWQRPRKTKK